MYVPKWFRLEDRRLIFDVLRDHSFATLFSIVDGRPFASHLPLIVTSEEPVVLSGHVARMNPQAAALDGEVPVLAVFHGPHAYISPSLYQTRPNVPTWNYVVVHASGVCRQVTDERAAIASLRTLVATYDPHLGTTNPEALDESFWRAKLSGIVPFELIVDELTAKAKMSQNRPGRDQASVVEGLSRSGVKEVIEVANWVAKLRGNEQS